MATFLFYILSIELEVEYDYDNYFIQNYIFKQSPTHSVFGGSSTLVIISWMSIKSENFLSPGELRS